MAMINSKIKTSNEVFILLSIEMLLFRHTRLDYKLNP